MHMYSTDQIQGIMVSRFECVTPRSKRGVYDLGVVLNAVLRLVLNAFAKRALTPGWLRKRVRV